MPQNGEEELKDMSPQSLIYVLIMVLVVILIFALLVYAIESFIGPIDSRIKALSALIIFLVLLLYILGHIGVLRLN
jgi:ABC-type Na+ efflux pump permease subunit